MSKPSKEYLRQAASHGEGLDTRTQKKIDQLTKAGKCVACHQPVHAGPC